MKLHKQNIIIEFLQFLAQQDIHLVRQTTFDKHLTMWNKRNKILSENNRMMMKVYAEFERLGLSEIETKIISHLSSPSQKGKD